ncbi:MAG: hypothetical protein AABY87_13865 [bacterium]
MDTLDPEREKALEAVIKNKLEDGRLPCAKAFEIAKEQKVSRQQVGEICNRARIKISRCQLGCFE